MSAKVVKNNNEAKFKLFSFPKIGGNNSHSSNVNPFVLPNGSELQSADTFASFENLDGIKTENGNFPSTNFDGNLQNMRDEAAKIIAQAEEQAASIAQEAREKAMQEVQAHFKQEIAAQTAEIRMELTNSIDKVDCLASEISHRHEKDLVELALHIAKKIVGREVTIDREIAFALVKVALGKLHNRAVAEVHLNPEDFVFVQSHREKLDFRGSLNIVEDRSISIGGCFIHTETGDIDARIESQFDEIAHGLLEG